MGSWNENHVHVSSVFAVLMVVLGAFGTVVHLGILGKAIHEYREQLQVKNLPKLVSRWSNGSSGSSGFRRRSLSSKKTRLSGRFLFMEFSLWISNLFACAIWFLLRTDLLFWGGGNKYFDVGYCRVVYTSNFVLFLYAKLWLHLALIYRLHITFRDTFFEINRKLLRGFAALIVVSVLSQISLFGIHVRREVEVGKTHCDIRICTLYTANKDHNKYSHIGFPVLFGCTDTFIDLVTICLFIRQLLAVSRRSRDPAAYVIIRKLTVLGILQVTFSLILYTLAMPFYPNLVMLVPLIAVMDSLCIFLVSQFAHSFYNVLCFPCDKMAEVALESVELTSSKSGERAVVSIAPESIRMSQQLSVLSSIGRSNVQVSSRALSNSTLTVASRKSENSDSECVDESKAYMFERSKTEHISCHRTGVSIEQATVGRVKLLRKKARLRSTKASSSATDLKQLQSRRRKSEQCATAKDATMRLEYESEEDSADVLTPLKTESGAFKTMSSPSPSFLERNDTVQSNPAAIARCTKLSKSTGALHRDWVVCDCGSASHRRVLSEGGHYDDFHCFWK